jgi:asparagine synthase (glutamine-hydrolysing)
MLTRFAKVYSFFGADMKAQLFRGDTKKAFDANKFGARHALARLQGDVKHLDALSQMLYIDVRANLPDDLLMVADKTSMACSLEARVPLLDYRLIEFIETLPPGLKLHGLTGKYLHKKACQKWLPKEVVYRKKNGFNNPIGDWCRGRMRPFVEECLLSRDSSMARYFDQNYIKRILELDRSGKQDYWRHIYLLVSLELWHQTFIKNTSKAVL